jgi:Carboxypeptidase regulatory-like domain
MSLHHPITPSPHHAIVLVLLLCVFMGLQGARAAEDAVITGTVVDQLGGRVSAATVHLVRDGRQIAETSTDASGEFTFPATSAGRYQVEVMVAGFERRLGDPIFVGESAHVVTQVRSARSRNR